MQSNFIIVQESEIVSKYLTDIIESSLMEEYLIPVIDKEIERQTKLVNFRAKGFHPSEVAGICPRYVILKRLLDNRFKQKPINTNLHRIFNDGTMAHEWYQNRYLGPAGVLWGKWICSRCKEVVEGFMPKDSCECQEHDLKNISDFCVDRCFTKDGKLIYENGYARKDKDLVDKRGD